MTFLQVERYFCDCQILYKSIFHRPTDPEKIELMNKWVDCCSAIRSEIFGDDAKAFRKRIGNVLPGMTIPVFAGVVIRFFLWMEGVSHLYWFLVLILVVFMGTFELQPISSTSYRPANCCPL